MFLEYTVLQLFCSYSSWQVIIFPMLNVLYFYVIIILILVKVFSPRFLFSWTNGDPHRSGFNFQTAVLSVLCVMFQVQLFFVVNLLNVYY